MNMQESDRQPAPTGRRGFLKLLALSPIVTVPDLMEMQTEENILTPTNGDTKTFEEALDTEMKGLAASMQSQTFLMTANYGNSARITC